MYILSQILVVIADSFFVLSMLSKKKIWLVLFLLFSDILFAVHYFCLNAITGSIVIFIDSAFLITMFFLEKYNKEKYTYIAVSLAFVGIIITTIFTWKEISSIFPLLAIGCYLVGMLFKNIIFAKSGALARNIFNIIYLTLIASYVGAGLEFCLMVSAIIGIILSCKRGGKMKGKRLNIAIDGHACSGKSVLAREIAKALKIQVFDTGALYRALACEWDERKLGAVTKNKIDGFSKSAEVLVKFINGSQHTFVNGKDYTERLRLESISVLSSKIASYQALRDVVLDIQREFAKNNDCVMEGRDIGSQVLPDADYKFFITAPVEVRAQRRFEQEKQNQRDLTFDQVLKDLKERDHKDETRKVAPLKTAPDSIIINTAGKTIEESLEECLGYIKKKEA